VFVLPRQLSRARAAALSSDRTFVLFASPGSLALPLRRTKAEVLSQLPAKTRQVITLDPQLVCSDDRTLRLGEKRLEQTIKKVSVRACRIGSSSQPRGSQNRSAPPHF